MVLDALRARLEALLADRARSGNTRAYAEGLYQAMVDTKVAIAEIRSAQRATERELQEEQQRLTDAERRGRLAEEIQDAETVQLASMWTTRHRERIEVLTRKRAVQDDELRMAERQMDEMGEAYRKARVGIGPGADLPTDPTGGAAEALDRELQSELGVLDRQAREDQARQQLEDLKRRMGK